MRRNRLIIVAALGLIGIAAGYFFWHASTLNSLKQEGLDLARQGEFARAAPILESALQRAPRDVDILRALAKGHLAAGRKDRAEDYLTRWLEADPQETEALQLRLKLYEGLGQFDKALLDADRLIELEPASLPLRRKRVALLYQASRFADAHKECASSLAKYVGDRELRFELAKIKQALGSLSEAGALLDGLLVETPKSPGVLLARAKLHLDQNEPDKALPLLRKILDVNSPKRPRSVLYYLAIALERVGQAEEAGRLVAEVHRMQDADVLLADSEGQPKNLPLQMRAARAQFDNNNLDKTEEIVRHVLSVDPDYAPAHALRADVERQRTKEKR